MNDDYINTQDLEERAQAQRLSSRRTADRDMIREPVARKSTGERHGFPTFYLGRPHSGYNINKALHLAAELEDEEIIRKLRAGK